MTEDQVLASAVSKMILRSEKENDSQKLILSFVDAGILEQIDNFNNQIIYGRRGTGKTHILKYFSSSLKEDPKNIPLYIDSRNLGSTSSFSDVSNSLQFRCLHLFQDILELISDALLNHLTDTTCDEKQFMLLQQFNDIITLTLKKINPTTFKQKTENSSQTNYGLEYPLKAHLSFADNDSVSNELEGVINSPESITFPEVNKTIRDFLNEDKSILFILIDEWSSIPHDLQPYLAEFLKRSFMTESNIVIKIATLEYRSNFNLRTDKDIIGFEFGGDVSIALEIDDFYVYDRNPENISNLFSQILYKHITSELPENYLVKTYNIEDYISLCSKLFTNKDVFNELIRAAEGVIRDFINIFRDAFFDAKQRKSEKIDKLSIVNSAQNWYERDKLSNLDSDMNKVLTRIVEDVIGNKKARSFMLQNSFGKNDMLMKLFDARVIHIMKQGYSDKDHPGLRYNVYSLDYGTYVALKNTKSNPQTSFTEIDEPKEGLIIPFDDKRSIRRIILNIDILNPSR